MTLEEKEAAIITHYGVMPQLKYFQSEIFELNEAIIKAEEFKKYNDRYSIFNLNDITEEIADVQMMLNQLKKYYSVSDIALDVVMNRKANRQLERIANENKIGG